MRADTQELIKACPVCNQSKTPCQAPAGLLKPQPIAGCPWSHISVNFIKGLSTWQGCTFSLMAFLVASPKLPSTKETVQLVLLHVLRLHGFPIDVLSDREPQFTSTFWREFCRLLGPLPVCLTHKVMGKWSTCHRRWRRLCGDGDASFSPFYLSIWVSWQGHLSSHQLSTGSPNDWWWGHCSLTNLATVHDKCIRSADVCGVAISAGPECGGISGL